MSKFIKSSQVGSLIKDGSVIGVGGFVGIGVAEEIHVEMEKSFLKDVFLCQAYALLQKNAAAAAIPECPIRNSLR